MKTTKRAKSLSLPLLTLITILLSACSPAGSRNNARLAFGGDPMTLDSYAESVSPLIEKMDEIDHYAVTAHSAVYQYKASIEENGVTTNIDASFTDINFLSGLRYVHSTTSNRPGEGVFSVSFSGSGSYDDSSSSPLSVYYGASSHSLTLEESTISGERQSDVLFYEFYQRALNLSIFPYKMPVPSLFESLLFLGVDQLPIFPSTLIGNSFYEMIESYATFLALEQDIEFDDELVGIYAYGDNIYGLGMYMDNADYTSFLSFFKTHYLKSHTEEQYASEYGNFYDALNLTRLALSVIVNSTGMTSFGINLDCDIKEPLGEIHRSDGTVYTVKDADISISIVFTLYQGERALQVMEEW